MASSPLGLGCVQVACSSNGRSRAERSAVCCSRAFCTASSRWACWEKLGLQFFDLPLQLGLGLLLRAGGLSAYQGQIFSFSAASAAFSRWASSR